MDHPILEPFVWWAVSGWFGIALITLLANPAVGLLGNVFTLVKWGEPLKVSTMAVAFALGFSERLFSTLVNVLEEQAAKTAASPGGPQAPKVPPPAPGGGPPAPAPTPADLTFEGARAQVKSWLDDEAGLDRLAVFLGEMKESVDAKTKEALGAKVSAVETRVGTDPAQQAQYIAAVTKAATRLT